MREGMIRILAVAGVAIPAFVPGCGGQAYADAWADREAAAAALARGQDDEALKLATRAIKSGELRDLRLARTLVIRISANLHQKSIAAARTDAVRTLELCDRLIGSGRLGGEDLAHAHNGRGLANEALGRADKALADFSAAVSVNPGFRHARLNRGNLSLQLRRYDEAAADYSAILKIDPADAEMYYSRGRAHLYRADYEKALADFNHAVAFGAQSRSRWLFYHGRASAHFLMGDYRRAVADFERSLDLNPAAALTRKNLERARKALRPEAAARDVAEMELWQSLVPKDSAPRPH